MVGWLPAHVPCPAAAHMCEPGCRRSGSAAVRPGGGRRPRQQRSRPRLPRSSSLLLATSRPAWRTPAAPSLGCRTAVECRPGESGRGRREMMRTRTSSAGTDLREEGWWQQEWCVAVWWAGLSGEYRGVYLPAHSQPHNSIPVPVTELLSLPPQSTQYCDISVRVQDRLLVGSPQTIPRYCRIF